MREVVIVEAVRTPIGRFRGVLSQVRADDMAGAVLKELITRTGISPGIIEDVIIGCNSSIGEQAGNIARKALLIADYPVHVPGTTVDRACGSSQQAVHFAAQVIMSGDMDVVAAGGVESMTRGPGTTLSDLKDSEQLASRYELINQGVAAERVAKKWGFDRRQLDEFSLESHRRAIQAQEEGRFNREIMPITATQPDGTSSTVTQDQGPRRDTSLEKLGSLKPAFMENGIIHAGNSSQISDGAAALLIMTREKADQLGLKARFRIVSRTVAGADPTLMLTAPVDATRMALEKAGLTIDDMDLYEVNEAFAPVPMMWMEELKADHNKLNVNGGAIALGHPIGCSGARLMVTLMHELERTGGRYGLQSICEYLGTANATIIERLS